MSAMGSRAGSTRQIKTVWRGETPWQWKAIFIGHAQPWGYRNYCRSRREWRFHLTPICAARDWSKWSVGICLGKRMIFLEAHR